MKAGEQLPPWPFVLREQQPPVATCHGLAEALVPFLTYFVEARFWRIPACGCVFTDVGLSHLVQSLLLQSRPPLLAGRGPAACVAFCAETVLKRNTEIG